MRTPRLNVPVVTIFCPISFTRIILLASVTTVTILKAAIGLLLPRLAGISRGQSVGFPSKLTVQSEEFEQAHPSVSAT
ncbi:MAG: hypothetical protein GY832_43220 [Chloroflexi bacterium]|nr:hypothetical protein [Chloroflexota bacterium]